LGTRSDNRTPSLAERGYRLLLRLYPSEIRDAYRDPILCVFQDMERDARRSKKPFARFRFVARVYADVILTTRRARQFERKRSARVLPRKGGSSMSTWKHDGTIALRFLRKQPGFTLVAAVTLALGIGANTAIFSVLYGVLLRPLGLDEPEALAVVRLHRKTDAGDVSGFFPPYLEDLRDTIEASGAARLTSYLYESVTLVQGDRVEELDNTLMVEGNFFEVMGVSPILGRTFTSDDVVPNRRGNVCVISETLWQGRFGGDPDVVGRALDLDNEPVVVVGVVPSSVPLPDATTDLWMPQGWDPDDLTLRGRLLVLARLSEPELLDRAQSLFVKTASELESQYPRFEDYTLTIVGFRETLVGSVRPAILLAAAGVSLILLIACANTANLLLSRAAMRATEMATRQAIGARRAQLASQLAAESLSLAALGGAIGVVAAVGLHRVLLAMAPAYLPRLASVRLDLPVLAFSVAITLATGLVFGLVPLAYTLRARSGSLGNRSGMGQGWASHVLVVAQVTLSVVLLVSAALMVRSLVLLQRVPLGFDVEDVAGARIYLDDGAYPEEAQQALYFESLLERLRARGDIDAAGAGSGLPMDPVTIDYDLPYTLPGDERTEGDVTQAFFRTITPGFFETLGIPLKAGRPFDSRDRADTQRVALINETFARVAWPERSPVGESFAIYGGRLELLVVGVVGDVHFAGPAADYKPEFYVPHQQTSYSAMTVVTRSKNAEAGARAIAEEAIELNNRQPVSSTFTMEALVAGALSTDRFLTWLLVAFATVALSISAAGIYGVISCWVNQSRRELGVRMAFGAGVENIVGLVLGRGLGLSLAGALLGLVASFLVTRLLARFLYGVGPNDAIAIGVVVLLLGGTATLASFLPAWRAAHVDPMSSLRVD
jgi:predicted permease